METSHTKNWQRVAIWVVAIIMAVGTLGVYFVIILQNNNAKQQAVTPTAEQINSTEETQTVDPTAYKTTGPVTELQKIELTEGTGAEAKAGDKITVHYKGTIATSGVKIDSSYDRGEPATFALSGLIQGWQDGIPGMKVGGKRRLVIPSELGYGSQGSSSVPPNTDLVFEIELIAVNPAQ